MYVWTIKNYIPHHRVVLCGPLLPLYCRLVPPSYLQLSPQYTRPSTCCCLKPPGFYLANPATNSHTLHIYSKHSIYRSTSSEPKCCIQYLYHVYGTGYKLQVQICIASIISAVSFSRRIQNPESPIQSFLGKFLLPYPPNQHLRKLNLPSPLHSDCKVPTEMWFFHRKE